MNNSTLSSQSPQVVVIKVGGALLADETCLHAVFAQIAALKEKGAAVVLVHGGGASVDEQLKAQGLTSEKYQGQRITPKAHIPVVAGALAGYVNKQLVATSTQSGLSAVGLSLADGDMCQATPVPSLAQVALVEPNNPCLLNTLLAQHFLPIVSSIATSEGELFNVNADIAAAAVTQLLQASLIVLSDTPGVLDANGELLSQLKETEIKSLIEQGVIQGGMQVKVDAALHAAKTLRRCVSILDWHDAQAINQWHLGQAVGTQIVPS